MRSYSLRDVAMRVACFVAGILAICFALLCASFLIIAVKEGRPKAILLSGFNLLFGLWAASTALRRAFERECPEAEMPDPDELTLEVAIARLGREGGPSVPEMLRVTELTVETARRLVSENTGDLYLPRVEAITPAVAAVLATCPGQLNLSGLVHLPPDCARPFAEFYRPLVLNGLKDIDVGTAEALSQHHGWLFLDGLTTLPPDAARWLARHEPVISLGDYYGWVSLNGLTTLSDDAACTLGTLHGDLSLDGIEHLSPTALGGLTRHTAGILSLRRLLSMPDEIAAQFAERTDILDVSGLRDISPEALARLRQNPCIRLTAESVGQ